MAHEKQPPRENLVRAAYGDGTLSLTRDADSDMPVLTGHAAVFGQFTEIKSAYEGHFMERIMPGAFAKTIRENRDRIKVLFQHGKDPQIGDKPLGQLRAIEEDTFGLRYEAPLVDTSYNRDLIPGLEAGLYGASFRFSVLNRDVVDRPRKSAHNPLGLREVSLTEVKLAELGPCTWGAYPEATAGLRSMTDDLILDALAEDPERLRELIETRRSRTFVATAPNVRVTYTNRGREEDAPSDRGTKARLYERSVEFVGESVWAVHPSTLATIVQVIRERREGIRLDPDEIKRRLKASPVDELDDDLEDLIGDDTDDQDDPNDAVAVLPLYGTIIPHATMFSDVSGAASVEGFTEAFREAVADDSKQAILIDINSPGGSVELVPELAAEILSARGTKPIVAMVNAFAASAAYWIATSADEIVVTPSGQVGSIGVYVAHDDLSQLQEKIGVKTTLVSAGKYKTEGNPFEPLDEEATADLQAKVDAYYQMFVQAVAAGRDVKASAVTDGFGQGRMVLAADAVEAGMADRVATYDDTLAALVKNTTAPTRSQEIQEPLPPSEASTPSTTTRKEPELPVATTRANRVTTTKSGLYLPQRKDRPLWDL